MLEMYIQVHAHTITKRTFTLASKLFLSVRRQSPIPATRGMEVVDPQIPETNSTRDICVKAAILLMGGVSADNQSLTGWDGVLCWRLHTTC